MLYRRKSTSNILVDLSPLIDVVFLLLIFFMVSTTFKNDSGLDLTLPGSSGKGSVKSETLVVLIDKQEKFHIEDATVELSDLETRIREQLENSEEKIVVLKVDADVKHSVLIRAMDAAKQAGARSITFATAPLVEKTEDL